MRATIIADASYCQETGAAGYGYWTSSDRGRQGGGGEIQKPMDGSGAAEMAALVNAVHLSCTAQLVMKGDFVLLQTDCQSAIDAFEGRRSTLTKDERRAKQELFRLKNEFGFTFAMRHVKGHSGRQEARFVTNNLCDKRAKNGMRLARRRLSARNEEPE